MVNLGDRDVVAMLRDVDDSQAIARGPASGRAFARATVVAGLVAGASILGTVLVALFFGVGKGHQVAWLLSLMFGVLILLPLGARGIGAAMRQWASTRALPRPARWALPEPRGSETVVARGPIECDEPMVSPLSGRPCVAWEVGLRRDADASGAPGTWWLLEQRCRDATVAGQAVLGSHARVEFPRQVYAGERGRTFEDFLQQRGLRDDHDGWHVFETVVEAGTDLIVTRAANDIVRLRPGVTALAVRREAASPSDRPQGREIAAGTRTRALAGPRR